MSEFLEAVPYQDSDALLESRILEEARVELIEEYQRCRQNKRMKR